MTSSTRPAGLGYLAWRSNDTTSSSFAAALTGSGTFARGFQEAPIPPGELLDPAYPARPGVINAMDWVTGLPLEAMTEEAQAALIKHMEERTVLTVIVHYKQVASVAYGVFDLADVQINGVSAARGAEFYLDIEYLGSTKLPFCPDESRP